MPPKKRNAAVNDENQLFESKTYGKKLKNNNQESIIPAPAPPKPAVEDESQKYTFKSPRQQCFSLPANVIYYFAKNPKNVQCHQSVIRTCKALFQMSQIIPVKSVSSNTTYTRITLLNKERQPKKDKRLIKLEKSKFLKLWIWNDFAFREKPPKFTSIFLKGVYKCSLQELTLAAIVLTFKEFQLLTDGGNLQKVYFHKNIIKNADGSATDFEKIFEGLLCKDMTISLPGEQGIGKNTAIKMAKSLESCENPCEIMISNIPASFEFQSFAEFLKANVYNQKHDLTLHFDVTFSPSYQNQLQQFIDEIIHIPGIRGPAVPIISFVGENEEAYNTLSKLRNNEVEDKTVKND